MGVGMIFIIGGGGGGGGANSNFLALNVIAETSGRAPNFLKIT